MSVIREVTSASLTDAWRTIDIDALQEDSSVNFDTSTLHPPLPELGEAEVRALAGQVRQLLRGGDAEGALRGCLEMPVYNAPDMAKVRHDVVVKSVILSFEEDLLACGITEGGRGEGRRGGGELGVSALGGLCVV